MDIDTKREQGRARQQRYRQKAQALHPAIVAGIKRIASDEQDRANRTATAINYQQLYPEQPYKGIGIAPEDMSVTPITVSVTKPGDEDYRPLCDFTREWQANR